MLGGDVGAVDAYWVCVGTESKKYRSFSTCDS